MIQTEYFGNDSLKNILNIISIHSAKKILLVTGKESYQKSGSKEKLSHYLKNTTIERFYDFEVNPNIKDVKTGKDIIKSFEPDLIIAIGGSSVAF